MTRDCECPNYYEDRQAFLGFINKTIAGWNMVKEAMGESREAVN